MSTSIGAFSLLETVAHSTAAASISPSRRRRSIAPIAGSAAIYTNSHSSQLKPIHFSERIICILDIGESDEAEPPGAVRVSVIDNFRVFNTTKFPKRLVKILLSGLKHQNKVLFEVI